MFRFCKVLTLQFTGSYLGSVFARSGVMVSRGHNVSPG